MNITLNIIKNIIKLYVNNNKFLNDFYYGDINKLTNENNYYKYPLLAAIPNGSTINRSSDNRFNSITYTFNIITADIVNGDESNIDDILSDSVQNMSDFISFLDGSEYFNEYNISINGTSLTMNTFFERFSDEIAGHSLTLGIEVPWEYIVCDIPMIDFEYKDLDC